MRRLLILCILGIGVLCASQQTAAPPASPSTSAPNAEAQTNPSLDPKRAQLKADSDALAKAAAELRELLAKTTSDQLSLPVIKKAEEVQRLAKQVQKDLKQH